MPTLFSAIPRDVTQDVSKVMKVANRAITDSDSKADTKEILRTFVDKITFDTKLKRMISYTPISVKK